MKMSVMQEGVGQISSAPILLDHSFARVVQEHKTSATYAYVSNLATDKIHGSFVRKFLFSEIK